MSALRKNVASQVVTFCLVNATTGAALTGATVTTKVAVDGTQSASAGTLTELGTGQYKYVPTQGETNGASVGFCFTATNAVPVNLHCFTTSQDPTIAQTGDAYARLGAPAGASVSADIAAVKAETATIQAKTTNLPAAPASTTNITAASGVTLAATTGLGNQTANITGNLSGSVGSVTGAVGSVTGAVGSVTGAVGSVTGSVGSVTGNVGGNVTGSVGSVAANGITATSIATDAINAASVKADAVTKIQNGLATPTNITAGTITTTTNLTNLPAAAALEATLTAMKGATFAGATDSLEAIRDRGDAAWATATGFSTLDAAGVRTAVGLASANLDTQLTAIDDLVDTEVAAIYSRLGAPAGASMSADIAAAKADTAAIKAKTDNLPAAPAAVGDIPTAATNAAATWNADRDTYANPDTMGEALGVVGAQISAVSAKLGTPAGASVSADIAAVKAETATIQAKTTNLPAAPASTTNITGGVITTVTNLTNAPTNGDLTATMKTSVTTAATAATPTAAAVTGAVGSVTGAVGSVTGNVGGNVGGNVTGTVGSVVGAVGSVTGNVGGNVVGSVASVVGAVGSLTTNNDKTGYALTSAERNAVSDALLDRADAIATGITTRQALEIAIAVLAGKLSGAATATITIRDVADTKNVVVASVDASGNRTAVTITP